MTSVAGIVELIGPEPIRFDAFVELALYHPEAGFYARGGGAGRRRDFLTSPEVGPLFGAVVARALDSWWRDLGGPSPFRVIDAGAGAGTLARSIRAAEPACLPALDLVLVERSAALRAAHPAGVTSRPDLPAASEQTGAPAVVLANELLDNLPFRLAERTSRSWAEVVVRRLDDRFAEELAELPDTDAARGDALAPDAEPGARIPLHDQAARWLRQAREIAGGGRVVVIDYASPTTADLAARPWTEWVRTYAAHGRGGHPLEAVGAQDITCEVAVDQLAAAVPLHSNRSQAEFLRAHGIEDLVEEGRRIWRERAHLGDLAAIRGRSRVGEAEALSDPEGLGAFRVIEVVA